MKVGDLVKSVKADGEFKILFIGQDSVVVENIEDKKQTIYWMRSFKKDIRSKINLRGGTMLWYDLNSLLIVKDGKMVGM